MDVIEKMARAIASANEDESSDGFGYLPLARAALIALRDGVTEGMIGAVNLHALIEAGDGPGDEYVTKEGLAFAFLQMIDHVLQEGEKVT